MKRVMLRRLLLSSFFFLHSIGLHASASLLKVFCHQSFWSDKIILYFDRTVTVDSSNPDMKIISCGHLSRPVTRMLKGVKRLNRPWYKLTCKKKGENLIFNIDKRKEGVAIDTLFFDAIGAQKGVAIVISDTKNKPSAQLQNNKRAPTVVIDYGHGGEDKGAVGVSGAREKDVVREVGKKVSCLLGSYGINVAHTRVADETVPLDKRTFYVNHLKTADLFVSIHANASLKPVASGIETFCTHPRLFSVPYGIQEKEVVGTDKSCSLAQIVHGSLIDQARTVYSDVIDRRVKQSVSQVLFGVQVPAILVELGFLTHPSEGHRLTDKHYQEVLAQGIVEGIRTYCVRVGLLNR